ncbi:MAG: TonB-dependent receptor [Phycisphaerales bacterium]|nr:TonB-dependent receptor [Phycisphaerales bacterium]
MRNWYKSSIALFVVLWVAWTTVMAQEQADPFGPDETTSRLESEPVGIDLSSHLEDIDLLSLEVPVVVTAGRREQKLGSSPYPISVITAEDIRRSGARSIPDALRLVPGVDVADLSYGNTAVSPRGWHGMISRHVLILVDGRQIYDPMFGGTLWYSWPFQLEDIERVEVIRGPGGIMWGPNANNGVINIITKKPSDQQGLTLVGKGGSRGMNREYVGYGLADEKLSMRISGEHEGSDGFKEGGSFLRKLDDRYRTERISLHSVYQAGPKDTVTISGGHASVQNGYPPSPMVGFGVKKRSGSQGSFLLGKWAHEVAENNTFELTGYVNDCAVCVGSPAIDYRYQQLALQLSHTFRPRDNHQLTWGIDTRQDLLDGTNADPFLFSKSYITSGIIGLYLHDEWRFAPRWILNLGGRIDYDSYAGWYPTGRISLAYEISETALVYGAVSRAVQLLPAGLRLMDIPMMNHLVRIRGNRYLDDSPMMAYEVGYRRKFFDRVDADLNLFWHEYEKTSALSMGLGPPGLLRADHEYVGSSSSYGVELDLKYAVNRELTLLGNYTYQLLDARLSEPYRNTEFISSPKHKFMLGARYSPTSDLHLSSHLYYVDAVQSPNPANPFGTLRSDPYFRLDLRAEHEFWQDRASVAVGVSNLLDSNHLEGGTSFLNKAEVPRMVYAELRIAFR